MSQPVTITPPYPNECVPFEGAKHMGYGAMRYCGRVERAHRVSYCQAHGIHLEDIRGKSVRHICDNPACINPAHLLIGTHADNMQDMLVRGRNRQPKGEANGRSKLTEEVVRTVLARREAGESFSKIAASYQVAPSTLVRLCQRKTWRHVK